MRSSGGAKAAIFFGLAGSTAAHIIMNYPVPYGYTTQPYVSVEPLGSKLTFPCQGNSVSFDRGTPTEVTAGATQLVNFTGSAVHGGGSCQFAVNYDDVPSPDPARWKVIYTILGGCPAKTKGNLDDPPYRKGNDKYDRPDAVHCTSSNDVDCVRLFDIPIPAGLPSGQAHFAWTWFNKIGNREMYMNCAPINVKSAAGDGAFLDKLPGLFVANVAGFSGSKCTGIRGVEAIINIPNPGEFGAIMDDFTPNPQEPCQAPGTQLPNFPRSMAGPAAPAGTGSGGGGASQTGPYNNKTTLLTFVTSPAPTAPSGNKSTATAKPTAPATAAASTAPTAPTAAAAPTSSSPPSNGGGGSAACTQDGMLVCSGTGLWGLCDHGKAVLRPVAPGTQCVDGQIVRAGARR